MKLPQEHLPSALAVLTPLKHSTSLSAMFVYIRVPKNNPVNARAPSFGPRLSLFSKVSYSKGYGKEPGYNETSLWRTDFASPLALGYIEAPLQRVAY